MSDENIYKQRKKISANELDQNPEGEDDPLKSVKEVQRAVASATGREMSEPLAKEDLPFEITGNMPPELRRIMESKKAENQNPQSREDQMRSQMELESGLQSHVIPKKKAPKAAITPDSKAYRVTGSDQFESLLQRLADKHHWEEFTLPSKGKFYSEIPEVIHVRAMTGEEEQILATPRWVKRGKAMDMIFERCIREKINTEDLLSVDRTHLLIYLRGISYTPEYDVEIKCPECGVKFSTIIDLNQLEVDECPENFGPDDLKGTLPASGFTYRYRLATGRDELDVSNYRDKRIQQFGDQGEDDTLLYRAATLLEEIEGVSNKKEMQFILKRLPIADVQHLRNEVNEPPFGVDTELNILCPACTEEFLTDLPLETNFFFPRKKKEAEALV